jgi:monoamine oxidase
MMRRDADVLIVGAGLAGLSAARAIAAAGLEPLVLEARDRVGGRTLNHSLGGGKVVEVGGQWVGPTQHEVLSLAAELGIQTFATFGEGDRLIEWQGRVRRYAGARPPVGASAGIDLQQAVSRLERLIRTVPADAPWLARDAKRLDGQTFETWLRRNLATKTARTLFEIAVEAVWAQSPRDLSLLHVLFYARSAGSFGALVSTTGGAQDRRFVGGSQLLSVRMAEGLGADRVLRQAPVRHIAQAADHVVVKADGVLAVGRRVIVALPPNLAARVAYAPPLPALRDQLVQRTPQGTVTKCMAIYERPFWRDAGLSGQAISDRSPVRTVFDNSPPDGSPGVLLGFLEGDDARDAGQWAEAERRSAVLATFERLFGPLARQPDEWIERDWAAEEWTRGGYGCAMPPGTWTSFGRALRAPVGRIHWAGAETATVWSGYMDGAVRSGLRAAREVIEARSQTDAHETGGGHTGREDCGSPGRDRSS